MFILDGSDHCDEADDVAAALHGVVSALPGAAFRDQHVNLPLDLSDALCVATASRLGLVTTVLREDLTVVEVPGYTEVEKRAVAV